MARRSAKSKGDAAIQPPAGKLALTIPEAAYVLGVTPRHVRRLIHDGHLASFYMGASHRVSHNAIDEFMAAGGTGRTPAEAAG